jgi:mannose-6-phosphate isomerase-like protein (cupin superfamily)
MTFHISIYGGKMEQIEKVNINQKLALFNEHWHPKIVGEINDFYVKLVKLEGEFVWHHHENEDEMFLVVQGELLMQLREREITVREGEFIIIPKGVEHLPVANDEVHIMLFEPKSTLNTGNVKSKRTIVAQWI